ncbi:hypothetical protein Pmani_006209 [Petrolisthes manimaculis]|uniref:Uncharacterized protein n=1 Tax=Petrolisthes manimaculis TaxID=1843537 RepID=A0AAE1QAR0_9EUCA|nr:hypothetical protein Pmani_006209 [Petrolisthes manimaculis]
MAFRLPETLQQKLPNTMAEGEAFGQDFSWDQCLACVPAKKENRPFKCMSADLLMLTLQTEDANEENDKDNGEDIEEIVSLEDLGRRRGSGAGGRGEGDEATPLRRLGRHGSLIRQTSIMDTPIITDSSGAMKLTFWV